MSSRSKKILCSLLFTLLIALNFTLTAQSSNEPFVLLKCWNAKKICEQAGLKFKWVSKEDIGLSNFKLANHKVFILELNDPANTGKGVEAINENADEIHNFIKQGGVVIAFKVKSSNPPGHVWTHRFSPYRIYFEFVGNTPNWRTKGDLKILNKSHPIFNGLKNNYPQIKTTAIFKNLGDEWKTLAVDKNSAYPSIIEAKYGKGKIIVLGVSTYPENADQQMFFENLFYYAIESNN